MAADFSHSTHGPRRLSGRLLVDVETVVAASSSAEAACAAYADSLSGLPDLDGIALWIRTRETNGGYKLVRSWPGVEPTVLGADHHLAQWADSGSPFAWQVSDRGAGSDDVDDGIYLFFAQERTLLLQLFSRTDEIANSEEIRCVQAGLADLTVHLVAHGAIGTTEVTALEGLPEIPIDLAFLEATAMGDHDFMRYMLNLCAEELHLGRARLRAAAVAEDPENVVFVAHKMRSTARTAGAEALDELLAFVETEGKKGLIVGHEEAITGCAAVIRSISAVLPGL